MSGFSAYWWRGTNLPGIPSPEPTGTITYWWNGLPVPLLSGTPAPATKPTGASELPQGYERRFPVALRTWTQGVIPTALEPPFRPTPMPLPQRRPWRDVGEVRGVTLSAAAGNPHHPTDLPNPLRGLPRRLPDTWQRSPAYMTPVVVSGDDMMISIVW